MSNDIFVSYSRRDQEFVTRLASDLDAHVAGVWFDQADIQPGEKWHDEILDGIRECKAFVLVLSPDAMRSPYVHEEVDTALKLGKPIFPVIYRPAKWADDFAPLVKDIQTINLQSGSYTDNFYKMVDGLVEAGAVKTTNVERPFLRGPAKIGLRVVLGKALRWALAWGVGWLVFWSMTFVFLFIFIALQNKAGPEDLVNFSIFSLSGMAGGLIGGFVAGLLTMFILRAYAPSILWQHISPTIRIWAVSGPLGMIISGVITVIMLIVGVISTANQYSSCEGIEAAQCLSQIFSRAQREDLSTITLILVAFFLFVTVVWFLTGMLAGWMVVRHVRRLEPGITGRQGWQTSTSWGCGAVVAAVITMLALGIAANTVGP
jgi:hypothetical protein